MKIAKMRQDYDYFTGKVSEIVRQLNLAGIAIIWIFRVGGNDSGGIDYSDFLKLPLGLFITSLACDLVQYVYQSIIWGVLNTYYYRKYQDEEKDVKVSGAWNYIPIGLFWLKTILTGIAYFSLFIFILLKM